MRAPRAARGSCAGLEVRDRRRDRESDAARVPRLIQPRLPRRAAPSRRCRASASRFDVEIIPFRLSPLTHATDPVKLYEAAAAGRPVVATPMDSLAPLRAAGPRPARGDAGGVRPRHRGRGRRGPRDGGAAAASFARENTWDVRARGPRRLDDLEPRRDTGVADEDWRDVNAPARLARSPDLRLRPAAPALDRGGREPLAVPGPGARARHPRHQGPLQALGPRDRLDDARAAAEHDRPDARVLGDAEDGDRRTTPCTSWRAQIFWGFFSQTTSTAASQTQASNDLAKRHVRPAFGLRRLRPRRRPRQPRALARARCCSSSRSRGSRSIRPGCSCPSRSSSWRCSRPASRLLLFTVTSRFADVREMYAVIVQTWFFLTPIVYDPSIVPYRYRVRPVAESDVPPHPGLPEADLRRRPALGRARRRLAGASPSRSSSRAGSTSATAATTWRTGAERGVPRASGSRRSPCATASRGAHPLAQGVRDPPHPAAGRLRRLRGAPGDRPRRSSRASASASSAATAPARARSSASSPGSCRPRRAGSSWRAGSRRSSSSASASTAS